MHLNELKCIVINQNVMKLKEHKKIKKKYNEKNFICFILYLIRGNCNFNFFRVRLSDFLLSSLFNT